MAILSKGITLGYKGAEASDYTLLTNLQEIPEISNGSPNKVEVTTLADGVKKYISGLLDGSQDMAFKFIHEKAQFETLAGMAGETFSWQVTLPDGITATFEGVPAVGFDAASPDNAITYTLTVIVESEIVFA